MGLVLEILLLVGKLKLPSADIAYKLSYVETLLALLLENSSLLIYMLWL